MIPLPANVINSIGFPEKPEAVPTTAEKTEGVSVPESIVSLTHVGQVAPEIIPATETSIAIHEQNIDTPITQLVTPNEMDTITSLANTEEQKVREEIEAAHGSQ